MSSPASGGGWELGLVADGFDSVGGDEIGGLVVAGGWAVAVIPVAVAIITLSDGRLLAAIASATTQPTSVQPRKRLSS